MDDDPLADRRAAVLRVVADQIVVERAEIGLPGRPGPSPRRGCSAARAAAGAGSGRRWSCRSACRPADGRPCRARRIRCRGACCDPPQAASAAGGWAGRPRIRRAGRAGDRPPGLRRQLRDARDQRGVGRRQGVAVEADVVLEAGAAVPAHGERPARHLELVPSDAGGGPGGAGQQLAQQPDLELEDVAPRRQGVLHAEDELHMRRPQDQPFPHQVGGVRQHGEVEHLDLRLDPEIAHARRKRPDEIRRVS